VASGSSTPGDRTRTVLGLWNYVQNVAGESILVEVRKECSVPRLVGLGCFEVLQENLETVLTRNEERRGDRMGKPKLMSKTSTLTQRETGPLKQPSYRVCKDGKFYYFSSVSGIRPALVALWWWFKELFIREKKKRKKE